MNNLYLAHHGILGQKWGVRRYQNEDGSLTEAGRKRYLNNLYNEAKTAHASNRPYAERTAKLKELSTEYVQKSISNEQKEKLSKLLKEAKNKEKNRVEEFEYGSKEWDEFINDAYDRTYEWFEKNDPEYLKEIIKNNNGDKAGLDGFHDFRKLYEGYEDELWDKYEKKWKENHPDAEKRNREADKAWDEYIDQSRQVIRDILGEYGDKKISNSSNTSLTDKVYWNTSIKDILDEYEKKK